MVMYTCIIMNEFWLLCWWMLPLIVYWHIIIHEIWVVILLISAIMSSYPSDIGIVFEGLIEHCRNMKTVVTSNDLEWISEPSNIWQATSSELRHVSTTGKKSSLNSNTSSTCPDNMVNFSLLTAEICWRVWGTPANFNGFRVLAALLHSTLAVGISQTLQRWTEDATYIWQGGHHVGHWPTF